MSEHEDFVEKLKNWLIQNWLVVVIVGGVLGVIIVLCLLYRAKPTEAAQTKGAQE